MKNPYTWVLDLFYAKINFYISIPFFHKVTKVQDFEQHPLFSSFLSLFLNNEEIIRAMSW